jgi:hypothetical protein
MKLKLLYIVNCVILLLIASPLMGQTDPGDDPDAPITPIDDYIWVLALVGLIFGFMKFRAYKNKKIMN